jgi:NADH-quinone oxidoreductase subunit G
MKDGDALLIVDQELTAGDLPHLARASVVMFAGTVLTAEAASSTTVVLPLTNFAEEEGTYTNLRGRVQRFLQAKAGPAMARPGWFVLVDLLEQLGDKVEAFVPSDVFGVMAREVGAFAGLSYDGLGLRGGAAQNGNGKGAT